MPIRDTLQLLQTGRPLSAGETQSLFDEILAGRCDDAQIAEALTLLADQGVTHEQITGAARSMRTHVNPVPTHGLKGVVIDTCGTGGAPKTFNVSTIAAIVAAAAAPGLVHVAKHGNRSRTGRGSAELLAALGVNIEASPHVQSQCLRDPGVCFCFAIHHHPAARHAAHARRSLAFPTMFNLLGPLCNPANASRQLMGVYDSGLVEPMARALRALGSTRAMVVHGLDGMDEISTTAPTLIAHLRDGSVVVEEFDAATLGLPRATLADLTARDLPHAAEIARSVLAGTPGPALDIVALNAGAAVFAAGVAASMAEGLSRASRAIASGAAAFTLERLARVSFQQP